LSNISDDFAREREGDYYVYHYRGLPIIALPVVSDRLRRAGVCRYPVYSFKRRIFRRLLQAAIFLRIDRFWSRRGPLPDNFTGNLNLPAFVKHLCQKLGTDQLFPVIHRPPQERRGRFYIHLLDRSGEPVAFVKVALDDFNNHQLEREAEALARHQHGALSRFKVPGLKGGGEFFGHRYIVLEPLPNGTTAVSLTWPILKKQFEEMAGAERVLSSAEIRRTEWWRRYEAERDAYPQDFNEECEDAVRRELRVCRVHGDLGVNNLARANGDLWVIDWEESSDFGPRRTDEIGHHISVHQKHIFRNPQMAARNFHSTFLKDATHEDRREVLAALAFLVSTGRDAAREIVRAWAQMPAPRPSRGNQRDFALSPASAPVVTIISNEPTPYRVHVLSRLAEEVEGVKIENIFTHTLSKPSMPWEMQISPRLRPLFFSRQHLKLNRPVSWRSLGLFRSIADHLVRQDVKLIVLLGYNDLTRMLLIRWARRHGIPVLLAGDSNVFAEARLSPAIRLIKRRYLGWVLKSIAGLMPMGVCGRAFFRLYRDHDLPEFLFPYEPDYDVLASVTHSQIRQFESRRKLAAGRKRFLVCGRLVDVKRVDLAIEAFAQVSAALPDWDLVIAGAGPLREKLEFLVPPDLTQRVKFLGFMQFEETAACFRACQVLVHASEFEPWGLVINEAVAAGMAVIATAVTGAAVELVSHRRNGLLVSPGSADALVDAMMEIGMGDTCLKMQAASAQALSDWRRTADPVEGFRQALHHFGVTPAAPQTFDSRKTDEPQPDWRSDLPIEGLDRIPTA
jgi:glycosyltransferase involved in cell wall biosynthesis